ncbi:MAG: cation diffusion facilitator family transporter [Desulfuromonas sp.]|nr:cation diffusion facilitator family transporter [Desulfuromonas sp.]
MNNSDQNICVKTARVAIITAASLALVKIIAGFITGSIALISSAVDSLLDLFMSFGNMLALHQANKPADDDHPYGHGKFESAATMLQSIFIGASGLFILYASVNRLRQNDEQLLNVDLGIAVLAISSVVSWILSRHLKTVGLKNDSTALQADALHYATDVYSNLALLAGLIGVKMLGWYWLDPVLSLGVGCFILYAAFSLLKGCLDDFLDVGLPKEQQQLIIDCIEKHAQDNTGYHNLRTRRSGKTKLIDFHLTFCCYKTIQEAHDTATAIEQLIKQSISNADVTIYLEPTSCKECRRATSCTRPENNQRSQALV